MATYVFEVQGRAKGANQQSWIAVEKSTGAEIVLSAGGNIVDGKSFVGQYPEIQEFLRERYQLTVALSVIEQIDRMITHPDGRVTWIFYRQMKEVIVHDILRTMTALP